MRIKTAQLVQNIKGVSLVEVLIGLSVSVVIGGLVMSIMLNSSGVQYSQSAKISQGLGVNDSLQKIRNTVKESQSVVVGYPEANPTYTTGANILAIKIPAIDNLENIIDGVFDYVVYVVEENRLKEKIFPNALSSRKSADFMLSNNVENVTFTYFDSTGQSVSPVNAEKIVVTIKLSQKAGSETESLIATSEARLRNN